MKNSIFKDFFSLSGARFLNILIGMISSMILVRIYSISEYGIYSQALIVGNIITTLMSLSVNNSCNYFIAKSNSKSEEKVVIRYLLTISIVQCIISFITTIMLSKFISNYFGNMNLRIGIIIVSILPMYNILRGLYEVSLISIKKTKNVIVSQVFISIITLILSIVFINVDRNIYWFMGYSMFINIILCVYMIISIKREFNLERILIFPQEKYLKSIFKYSIPIWLGGIVGTLNVQIDKLYIAKKVDIEALAIYTNMSKELPLAVISASIIVIITPYMVKYYKEKKLLNMIELWRNSIELCWIILCVAIVFLFFMATESITILYSEAYLTGIDVFRIYIILLLFRVTYFGLILNVTNNTKYIAYYTAITFFINILLNSVLYNLIGYNGPALATLLSNFIVGALQIVHASKLLECKVFDIMPFKKMSRILVQCVIIGLFMNKINNLLMIEEINYLIRFIIVGVLYSVLCTLIFIKRVFILKEKMITN